MTNPIPQDEYPEEPDHYDDLLRRLANFMQGYLDCWRNEKDRAERAEAEVAEQGRRWSALCCKAEAERDDLRIDRDSHQRVCLKVMVERDTAVKALRRCHAVMYGDGVMDQEQAWDECLRVLDEWTWTAARIALDEAKP